MSVLYSFDLFDTLLARRTRTPSGVFILMQRSLQGDGVQRLPERLLFDFAKYRVEAEREARRRSAFSEIRFGEIYACLAERFSLDAATIEFLQQKEIATERAVLYPIVENMMLFRRRKQQGRVAVVSDMYYDAETLRIFLTDAGRDLFADVPVYSSADWRATKAEGRLFGVVMLREKVRWGEVEHIGDNRHADYEIPHTLDIPAVHYKRTLPRLIAHAGEQCVVSPLVVLTEGVQYALMEQCSPELISNEREKWLYAAGAQVAGPILWAFVCWLLKTSLLLGHKRLYFLSRDGQILMKIADTLIAEWGWNIETRYLYSSRVSWLFAAMQDFDEQELAWVFQPLPYLSPQMIAERFHVSREDFNRIAQLHGGNIVPWERPLSREETAELKKIVTSERNFFMSRIVEERTLLAEYLRQEKLLEADAIALVDVGWLCRSQDALVKILQALDTQPKVNGFYLGCLRGVKQERHNRKYGMLTFPDDEGFCHVDEGEFKKFICFVESMLEGDHGHVEGYQRTEPNVAAVLKEASNGSALDWGLRPFQQGILDFAREFSRALHRLIIHPDRKELEELVSEALINYRKPTKEFAAVFGDFPYAWDPSHCYLQKLAPSLSAGGFLACVKAQSVEECHVTYWLAGSLARSSSYVRFLASLSDGFRYCTGLMKEFLSTGISVVTRRRDFRFVLLFPFCEDTPQVRFYLEVARSCIPEKLLIVFTGPSSNALLKSEFKKYGRVWCLMKDRSKRERRLKTRRMRVLEKILRDPSYWALGAGSSDFYKLLLSHESKAIFWEILTDDYNTCNPRVVEKLSGCILFSEKAKENVWQNWKINGIDPVHYPKIHIVGKIEEITELIAASPRRISVRGSA